MYHQFSFVVLEVLYVQSNKEMIDTIKKNYKDKSFNSVVLAPGHGAENDAQINWPNKFTRYEDLFPCIKACISITKHVNISTSYQSKTLNWPFNYVGSKTSYTRMSFAQGNRQAGQSADNERQRSGPVWLEISIELN